MRIEKCGFPVPLFLTGSRVRDNLIRGGRNADNKVNKVARKPDSLFSEGMELMLEYNVLPLSWIS